MGNYGRRLNYEVYSVQEGGSQQSEGGTACRVPSGVNQAPGMARGRSRERVTRWAARLPGGSGVNQAPGMARGRSRERVTRWAARLPGGSGVKSDVRCRQSGKGGGQLSVVGSLKSESGKLICGVEGREVERRGPEQAEPSSLEGARCLSSPVSLRHREKSLLL